jgi:glucose-6-phosphate 1-dehydrogenase
MKKAPEENAGPVLLLLGGTGDLACRMLLPSLFHLEIDRMLPDRLRLIGVARDGRSPQAYRDSVRAAIALRESFDEDAWQRFVARIDYFSGDITKAQDAQRLAAQLEAGGGPGCGLVIYFSLSPSLYAPACQALAAAGLITATTRLVLEKPIGRDLASSQALNSAVAKVADESQIFRIDHYLGKETVQNLIALRFANIAFEPLWTNHTIDHVQITVAETEGVGDRWPYYNDYGALRDMLQNHMIQLLCLIAMEPPADLDPDAVRQEKVKVLKALRPITRGTVAHEVVLGQYGAGVVEGKAVEGYLQEIGKPSNTESFVALRCAIDNWRWAGTPFFLRTGKRLPERRTQIVIQFKALPHSIFSPAANADMVANRLVIDLQPHEDISLLLMNQRPGLAQDGMRLESMPLSLSLAKAFSGQNGRRRIAYERLLLDIFRGDRTLFVHRNEVEEAWQWVDGVANAWSDAGMKPKIYGAGSMGPAGVHALIERSGHQWHD